MTVCPHCGAPLPASQEHACQAERPFGFGNAVIQDRQLDCCGKPQGCTNPTDGCLYKGHPFKRHLYAKTEPDT